MSAQKWLWPPSQLHLTWTGFWAVWWTCRAPGTAFHLAVLQLLPAEPRSPRLNVALSPPQKNREHCKIQALPTLTQPEGWLWGSPLLQRRGEGGTQPPLLPVCSASRYLAVLQDPAGSCNFHSKLPGRAGTHQTIPVQQAEQQGRSSVISVSTALSIQRNTARENPPGPSAQPHAANKQRANLVPWPGLCSRAAPALSRQL